MTSLSVSEYLKKNALDENEVADFLKLSGADKQFVENIRKISALSALPESERNDEELDACGLSVSNFLIKYARKHEIPSSAIFQLKRAAENFFLKE